MTLETDIDTYCPDTSEPIESLPADNDWQREYDEYLRSIGQLGAVSVSEGFELSSMRIVEKPRTNAKPKGYKSVADLGVYETEEGVEQVTLPTLQELEELLEEGLISGDLRCFIEAIWTIHKADDRIIDYIQIENMPKIKDLEKGVTDRQARIIFSFWEDRFDKEAYSTKYPAVISETADEVPMLMKLEKGLVHPDSAVFDRNEYLRQVKARMFDEDEFTDEEDKVLFRAHRNEVLDADPEEVAEIVTRFYAANPYLLSREEPGRKFAERRSEEVIHPLVSDKKAIEQLFRTFGKNRGGGAGLKIKPSVKKVILSPNQKRLAELTAIYEGNKKFYEGHEDEPTDKQKPRRLESAKPIRDKAQNQPSNVNRRRKNGVTIEVEPMYAGIKPNVLVMARGMKRTVTYL